jgi:hypothetical protein
MDVTLTSILQHINNELPYVWIIMTSATFLAGLYFAVRAIMLLREYADLRSGGNPNADIRKPIIGLLVAVALLYWPTLFHMSMLTVFDQENPMSYSGGGKPAYDLFMQTIGAIIQAVGFFSFIRGWILLARIGQQGAQPGEFSRAVIHIIAGLMAINIFGTWDLLKSIIGLS